MRQFKATDTKYGGTYTWSLKELEEYARQDGIIEYISGLLHAAMMETRLIEDEEVASDTYSEYSSAAGIDVFRTDPVRWWNDRSKTWTSPEGIRALYEIEEIDG